MAVPVGVQQQIQDDCQVGHGDVAQEARRGPAGVRGHGRGPLLGLLDELLQQDVVEVLQ